MSDVTKPILLDETGQDIVDALNSIADNCRTITIGSTDLVDGESQLSNGTLYVYVEE